jgi:microcystin degradation protein MlrC
MDRRQKFEPNHFRSLGIEPTERKILVCKAEMQHRAGFEIVARTFIDVDAPGLATQALARLPSSRVRRPVFPLNDIHMSTFDCSGGLVALGAAE